MWTSWHRAAAIQQIDQNQISYSDGRGPLDTPRNVVSVMPLRGLTQSRGGMLVEQANALVFKKFTFNVAGTVQGCQVQIYSQRLGRIQDQAIQLYYQTAIGENRAVAQPEDMQVYGSELDLWDVEDFSSWNDPEFGVLVDLQPHVSIPSSNIATIYYVQMRLWVV